MLTREHVWSPQMHLDTQFHIECASLVMEILMKAKTLHIAIQLHSTSAWLPAWLPAQFIEVYAHIHRGKHRMLDSY